MPNSINPSEKIILALDGMDGSEAISLIKKIPKLSWTKVGLELFVRSGPEILTILREYNKRIFLDLKFHDIPNTMANVCRQAAKNGAELITVHACAGRQALLAANKAAFEGAVEGDFPPPTLLGVTVLTSWRSEDFANELVLNETIEERVESMAALSFDSGIGGCVCSALEVSKLRKKYPLPFELITPGIRLPGENFNDQARVLTPAKAINLGASKLVIGRSITHADNPCEAFQRVCDNLISF